ncbi:MAG: hypothetical protein Q7U28_14515 [Aquabacterium sp.]|nr:hypothetical protein [Aquabacterium sp.]
MSPPKPDQSPAASATMPSVSKTTLLALSLALAASSAHAVTPSSFKVVPPGRSLIMIGQAPEPAVNADLTSYVKGTNSVPAGFGFFLIMTGDLQRTRQDLATIKEFMDRYPGAPLTLALGYGTQLSLNGLNSAALLAGGYDAELKSIEEWLRSLSIPVFLKPMYEFDRACLTYGPPALYVKAYRYLADRVRKNANNNVALVWHSAGAGYKIEDVCPIERYFPGKAYVDYFATSFFTPGRTDSNYASYMQKMDVLLNKAKKLGLPLMIAESTAMKIGTTSGQASVDWMNDYFDFVEKYDIRIVNYSARQWGKRGGVWSIIGFPDDGRIQSSPEVLATWRQRVSAPRYLATAGPKVFDLLGYKPNPTPLTWSATPEAERDVYWPLCPGSTVGGTAGWCTTPFLPWINAALPPAQAQVAQNLLKAAITPVNTATQPVQQAIKTAVETATGVIKGIFGL